MPVQSTDIKFYHSSHTAGGISSLGGAINTAAPITSGQLNNLFDDVTGAEASAGRTEYRCLYVRNESGSPNFAAGSDLVANVVAWLSAATTTSGATISIAVDSATATTAGDGTTTGVATTVADETDSTGALAGLTFVSPTTAAGGLALPRINAGQSVAIWVRRAVPAGAAAANDSVTLNVQGDSGP